jgi:hypothetical protein
MSTEQWMLNVPRSTLRIGTCGSDDPVDGLLAVHHQRPDAAVTGSRIRVA